MKRTIKKLTWMIVVMLIALLFSIPITYAKSIGDHKTNDKTPPVMNKTIGLNAVSPTAKGVFEMRLRNVGDEQSGVDKVDFVVKQRASGDKVSFKAIPEPENNDWYSSFYLERFNNEPGRYEITAYATDKAGNMSKSESENIRIIDDNVRPTIGSIAMGQSNPTTAFSFAIYAKDITDDAGIDDVVFYTWHEEDTLVKEESGWQNPDGNWSITFKPKDFDHRPGKYYVSVVARDTRGNTSIKTVYFDLELDLLTDKDKPEMGDLLIDASNPTDKDTFKIVAKDVIDISGVKSVELRIKNTDVSSAEEVAVKAISDGSQNWEAIFDREEAGGFYGEYEIVVFAEDYAGNRGAIKQESVEIRSRLTETKIMGESEASVEQMISYFIDNQNGYKYPAYYLEASRNTNLRQFAQMYYDVSVAEGVRPEVAWVQMCLETKYLQFGGDVTIDQFNFAGLGATGGGERGFNFAEVYGDHADGLRYGIIGHVQHLKCYASYDSAHYLVDNQPIDPRWDAAVKAGYQGSVSFIEDLENNWAAMPGYSIHLLDGVERLLKMPKETITEDTILENQDVLEKKTSDAKDINKDQLTSPGKGQNDADE